MRDYCLTTLLSICVQQHISGNVMHCIWLCAFVMNVTYLQDITFMNIELHLQSFEPAC